MVINYKVLQKEIADQVGAPSVKRAIRAGTSQGRTVEVALEDYGREFAKMLVQNSPVTTHESKHHIIEENALYLMEQRETDDGYVASFGFYPDAVSRDSLADCRYAEHLDNIVLLYANGYTASAQLHGEKVPHTSGGYAGPIGTQVHREPNPFLKKTVNEFNKKHAKDGVHAELQNEYLKTPEA